MDPELNRIILRGDNLPHLRSMNDEIIDLVVIDPPFNKRRTFESRNGYKFTDTLTFDAISEHDISALKSEFPRLWSTIVAISNIHGSGMQAYLYWLAIRLVEIRRILSNTGIIYIHCDHSSNAYIRLCMDAIFNAKNFQNEIIWFYPDCPSSGSRAFPSKHDTILSYSKSSRGFTFNRDAVRIPYHPSSIRQDGRRSVETNKMGVERVQLHPLGKVVPSVWDDIGLAHRHKGYVSFPTAKPTPLYERIIRASSNLHDIVLDAFAGSGTTLLAAERLGRRWIGIEQSEDAVDLMTQRLRPELRLLLDQTDITHELP